MSTAGGPLLRVADPRIWDELESAFPLSGYVRAELGPHERIVSPRLRPALDRALEARGLRLLVRSERQPPAPSPLRPLPELSPAQRALLHRCQRRARDGVVVGPRTWDPHAEAEHVQALLDLGLLRPDEDHPTRFHLAPLPPPPPVVLDLSEAVMPIPEDLGPAGPSLSGMLSDLAILAAAWVAHPPRLTVDGTLDVASLRRVGRRLGDSGLAERGRIGEADPRWSRATRVLLAMGLMQFDEVSRLARPSPALEALLERSTAERLDAVARRLVDPDQHPLLPALREALRQAEGQAIDEVIFRDLLAQQQRDVLYSPWGQVGRDFYPQTVGEAIRFYNRDSFDEVEGAALHEGLDALVAAGLLRRAPGVFAATPDGQRWAGLEPDPRPPIVLSGDLELLLPPGAVEPWERYLLELACTPVSRDVVDRLRLTRKDLERYLAVEELPTLLGLLQRRAAHPLSEAARSTLARWSEELSRVVWVEQA